MVLRVCPCCSVWVLDAVSVACQRQCKSHLSARISDLNNEESTAAIKLAAYLPRRVAGDHLIRRALWISELIFEELL